MRRRFEAEYAGKPWRRLTYGWFKLRRMLGSWSGSGALDAALSRFTRDGLVRVLSEVRSRLPEASRCVACSLCTFSCRAVKEGLAPPSFEPKQIVLGHARGTTAGAGVPSAWVPCLACGACTVQCPNDVPLHRIAESLMVMKRPETAVKRDAQPAATASGRQPPGT